MQHHRRAGLVIVAVLAGLASVSGCGSSGDARVEQLALRVDSLATTLTLVTQRLNAGAPLAQPETLTVSTSGAATRGDPGAPVTIVEFTDYQCPFCGRHATTTLSALDSAYIRTGKVRYVLRDLPLGFHAMARPTAIAARCAGRQDAAAYWRFHDAVFAAQDELADSTLERIAGDLRLEPHGFRECRASPEIAEAVDADAAAAARLGLTGTPAFIVGRTGADSLRGVVIRGALPYAQFAAAVDEMLAGDQVAVRK